MNPGTKNLSTFDSRWLFTSAQRGQVTPPSKAGAAQGKSELDKPQRAHEIGQPVPIVFCRYRNNAGGILISPAATEARFTNSNANAVTAYYHLIISEGQIDKVKVKDIYQRYCRVGSSNQSYDRRAGSWSPGNAIVQRAGYTLPECPRFCGSKGFYTGISTFSFQSPAYPDGSDLWNRQVHLFIRGGMYVTRLFDNATGPSDNFADLINWIWANSARVPSLLVDTDQLRTAATFLETNGFTCNAYITEARSIGDLVTDWSRYFLLAETSNNGKKGLRPLLPTDASGAIVTTAVTSEYDFTENEIVPGSFSVSYIGVANRRPFVCQVTWRQSLADDAPIIRTVEVKYTTGNTSNGPYETHDLSAFCTNETHAVKVGAYILAKRVHTGHTVQFTARPQQHNRVLSPGSIVRVRLGRQVAGAGSAYHDWLYQVDKINRAVSGEISYECSQFPIDAQGRSLIALDVAEATASGTLLSSDRTGLTCDVNSSTDNTDSADVGQSGSNLGLSISELTGGLSEAPSGSTTTQDDGLDGAGTVTPTLNNSRNAGVPQAGAVIESPSACPAGTTESVKWYRNDAEVTGIIGRYYVIGTADIQAGGSTIKGIWYCTSTSGGVTTTTQTLIDPVYVPAGAGSILDSVPGKVLIYTGSFTRNGSSYMGFRSRDVPTVRVEPFDSYRNFVAGTYASMSSASVVQQWSQYWGLNDVPGIRIDYVWSASSYNYATPPGDVEWIGI